MTRPTRKSQTATAHAPPPHRFRRDHPGWRMVAALRRAWEQPPGWPADRLCRSWRRMLPAGALPADAPGGRPAGLRLYAALLALGAFAAHTLMSICLMALDCRRNARWLLACRLPGERTPAILTDGQMHALLAGIAAAWLPAVALGMAAATRCCGRRRPGAQRHCLRRLTLAQIALDVLMVWIAARLHH